MNSDSNLIPESYYFFVSFHLLYFSFNPHKGSDLSFQTSLIGKEETKNAFKTNTKIATATEFQQER